MLGVLVSDEVLITIIVTMGGLLTAMLAKMRSIGKDSAAARSASERAESSLNNSPHTITERLLSISEAQDAQGAKLTKVLESQGEHGKDIRGMQEDLGALRGADRALRKEVAEDRAAATKAIRQAAQTALTLEKVLPHIEHLVNKNTTSATPPGG